jgi:hypothetical protein
MQAVAVWMGAASTVTGAGRREGRRWAGSVAQVSARRLSEGRAESELWTELDGGVVLALPPATGVQRTVIEFQHRGEAMAWARGWPETSLGAWWEARWRHAAEARGWCIEALQADPHRTRLLVRTRRAGAGVVAATLAAAIQWPRHAPVPRVESVSAELDVDLPSFTWETAEASPAVRAVADAR